MWVNEKSYSRKELKQIAVPERENVGRFWKGIPHGVLADTLVEMAQKMRLDIVRESWLTNPSKTDLFGRLDFKKLPGTDKDTDMGFSLGVLHSNVGRTSVRFLVGGTVFCCSNGVVIAEKVISKKHTTGLNLSAQVERGLEEYIYKSREVTKFKNKLLRTKVAEDYRNRIMVATASAGLISWSGLGKVYDVYQKPPHEEFLDANAWSLYNAFTEVGKDMSPANNSKLLRGLHHIFTGQN